MGRTGEEKGKAAPHSSSHKRSEEMSGYTPQSVNTSSGPTNPEEPTPKSARTGSLNDGEVGEMAMPVLITVHADGESPSAIDVSSSLESTDIVQPTVAQPQVISLITPVPTRPSSVHSVASSPKARSPIL